MSSFSDRAAKVMSRIKSTRGESGTYTNVEAGTTQSLTCLARDRPDTGDVANRNFVIPVQGDLTVRSGGPKRGDTYTDADGTWTIVDTGRNEAAVAYEFDAVQAIQRA